MKPFLTPTLQPLHHLQVCGSTVAPPMLTCLSNPCLKPDSSPWFLSKTLPSHLISYSSTGEKLPLCTLSQWSTHVRIISIHLSIHPPIHPSSPSAPLYWNLLQTEVMLYPPLFLVSASTLKSSVNVNWTDSLDGWLNGWSISKVYITHRIILSFSKLHCERWG